MAFWFQATTYSSLRSIGSCRNSKVCRNCVPALSPVAGQPRYWNYLNPNLFCNENTVWNKQNLASGKAGQEPNKTQVITPLILITDITKEKSTPLNLHLCYPLPLDQFSLVFQQLVHSSTRKLHIWPNPLLPWLENHVMCCCWFSVKSSPFINIQVLKSQ